MAEPIIEQIAAAIETAIDAVQDPDATLTINAVRPKIVDWEVSDFKNNDVIIETFSLTPDKESSEHSKTTVESRTELGTWNLYGIITTLPTNTAADTMLARMAETIRRTLLAKNTGGKAFSGLAQKIDCPEVKYDIMDGGVVAKVIVKVSYMTALADGYPPP